MIRYFIAGAANALRPVLTAIILAGSMLPLWASDIMKVLPLSNKVIMLHFSDGYVIHYGYGELSEDDSTVVSPLDSALAALASSYLISSGNDPNYTQGVQPTQVGRKSKGSDFSRDCQWNGTQCVNDIVFDHWIYLVLDEPMQTGSDYTIFFGSLAENLDDVTFVYDEKNLRSEAVHVNQIGFVPDAQQKFAYVSHWMGELGSLSLDDYSGNTFWLIDLATGNAAFQGSMNLRFRKTQIETGQTGETPGENFTAADVWECDFSNFSTPGEYVVAVEGIGSSFPFRIAKDVYRDVYITTTRGLYHHRAGIAKEPPFTDWFFPADHHPDMGTVINYSTVRFMDQTNENGNESEVLGNIAGTADSTWGWYHDAGDWDGYPEHFRVPQTLMLVYELAPKNFSDGELNIPESGNGIPDILDEAEWLVKYFERNTGPTGGIFGARIHADFAGGNPDGVPSWEDAREWVVFGEEPRTTYNFAGNAANLAYCLRIAEEETGESFTSRIEELMAKATSAWNWAESNLQSGDEAKVRTARHYAAATLYKATGQTTYLARFIQTNLLQQGNYDNNTFLEQRWGGWSFALIPDSTTGLDFNLRSGIRNLTIEHADFENLLALDRRSFRFAGNFWMPMLVGQATTPWVIHSIMAYEISGEQRFINAVQTTCDYFLGGNPLNMVWVSGIGERNPSELLHLDSWYDGKDQMVPGIVPYGPHRGDGNGWNGPWDADYARDRAVWPPVSSWPGHELYFENRYCPITNEYTVHQNIGPAAAVYGYLAGEATTTTGIGNRPTAIDGFALLPNYPNPFNPTTTIQFTLPIQSEIRIDILSVTGQKVTTLVNNTFKAGTHSRDFDGSAFASGLYFYRMTVGEKKITRKMLLVK